MADILEREILTLLPDELVAVIKERNIIQEVNGETYQQKSRLWLPSYTEVFGKQNGCNYADCRDIQFQLFQTEKDRIRMDEEGKTNCYFLRSPVTSNSTAFCSVSSSGTRSSNNASDPLGICPCFIVGK
jgi:hypothetical protein